MSHYSWINGLLSIYEQRSSNWLLVFKCCIAGLNELLNMLTECFFFLPGIYDDDPEIITLDRGEFGKSYVIL